MQELTKQELTKKETGNRHLKRIIVAVLAVITMTVMLHPQTAEAATEGITIESKDNKVPTYKAGEKKTWTFIVTNHSGTLVNHVMVAPDLGENNDVWPFKTEMQSYQKDLGTLDNGAAKEVSFDFTQREDVPTSRYTLKFKVTAEGQEEAEKQFYVNTTARPEQKSTQDNKNNKDSKDAESDANTGKGSSTGENSGSAGNGYDASYQSLDAGGYSNGEAAYSGGSDGSTDGSTSSGNGSVPRVIVTGFSTDPAEVRAGSNFKLTIHLKNTSKMKVSNMLFDLSAPTEGSDEQTTSPAFLPASGASSIYLDGIAPNGTADISIELNAKSDLLQKPYSMDLSMKYEDPNAAQIEGSSSVSIPVKQDARFEFSDFEISPQSIAVGEEANVMCSLYNLGRIKLYNVKATFEGENIKKEEVFIGNVESGATGSIDAMLEGKKVSDGPAKVTMTLSYEDESGNISTTTKDLNLEVTEKVDDEAVNTDAQEEPQKSVPVIPVVIAVLVIAIVAAIVIRKKHKKKQLAESEEEELLDELERSSEDEHQ